MHIKIDNRRIFFDVDGEKLVPDGPVLREKPTLIVLHGAPGMSDHSAMKPHFKALTDDVQLIYIDLPGAGRSDDMDLVEGCMLEAWADDLAAFCEALSIDRPFILGFSAGGFVAQVFAIKYSDTTRGVILASTQAKFNPERSIAVFERLGGADAEAAARGMLTGDMTPEVLTDYNLHCMPLYSEGGVDHEAAARVIFRMELAFAFHEAGKGKWHTMDLRGDLSKISCPVLVLAGVDDPITPIEDSEDIVTRLTSAEVNFERLVGARHGTWRDKPEESFAIIREFISATI